jgi:CheY-like chemotaxis protein
MRQRNKSKAWNKGMSKKPASAVNNQVAGKPKPVILIVDDEFDITSTFSMLFQLRGFETLIANNGQHALDVMKTRIPDIILSDCMMPVMDGIEFSMRVRNEPATADIPIILISAAPEKHNLSLAECNIFLRKPIRFHELLASVLKLLPL